MEKRVNAVMEEVKWLLRERVSLPRRVAVDVNVVDETMRIAWLVNGRVGERMEARHLMYVTKM